MAAAVRFNGIPAAALLQSNVTCRLRNSLKRTINIASGGRNVTDGGDVAIKSIIDLDNDRRHTFNYVVDAGVCDAGESTRYTVRTPLPRQPRAASLPPPAAAARRRLQASAAVGVTSTPLDAATIAQYTVNGVRQRGVVAEIAVTKTVPTTRTDDAGVEVTAQSESNDLSTAVNALVTALASPSASTELGAAITTSLVGELAVAAGVSPSAVTVSGSVTQAATIDAAPTETPAPTSTSTNSLAIGLGVGLGGGFALVALVLYFVFARRGGGGARPVVTAAPGGTAVTAVWHDNIQVAHVHPAAGPTDMARHPSSRVQVKPMGVRV